MQNCFILFVQPINHESFFDKGKHIFPIFADICDPGWSYFNGYCYFTSETVQTGPQRCQNVARKTRFLLISKTTRKMSLYNTAIMVSNHGWDWMTYLRRATSPGWIEKMETLQTGPTISQIITKKRIVCTPLVWNIIMNGMMFSVAIATSTLVRKVRLKPLFIKICLEKVGTIANTVKVITLTLSIWKAIELNHIFVATLMCCIIFLALEGQTSSRLVSKLISKLRR